MILAFVRFANQSILRQKCCQSMYTNLQSELVAVRYQERMIIFMLCFPFRFTLFFRSLFSTGINSNEIVCGRQTNCSSKQITVSFFCLLYSLIWNFWLQSVGALGWVFVSPFLFLSLSLSRFLVHLVFRKKVVRIWNLLSQCQFTRFAMNFEDFLLFNFSSKSKVSTRVPSFSLAMKHIIPNVSVNLLTNWYCLHSIWTDRAKWCHKNWNLFFLLSNERKM